MKQKMWIQALLILGLSAGGYAKAGVNDNSRRPPHRACPCCCLEPLPRQDRQRPPLGPPPPFMSEALIKSLSLTDEQVRKIKDMESSFREQMDGMRESDRKAEKKKGEEMKRRMDSMMEARQDSLKAILSEEQYKSFLEYMENNRPEMPDAPDWDFGGGPGPDVAFDK